jgi:cytochrome c2
MNYRRNRAAAAVIGGIAAALAVIGVTLDAADERRDLRLHAAASTGGDPERGEAMFIQYGCGSCHRAIIGGKLDNTPDNLQAWIRNPQRISPGTAMPDLHVGKRDARDISAFLYTRAE